MKHAIFVTSFLLAVAVFSDADETDGVPANDHSAVLVVADLDRTLDGEVVTIRFTVADVDGIAQLTVSGQAPTFNIDASRHGNKTLSVWVEGELANILDRLQMAYLQDNEIKTGTKIQATGKLHAHKTLNHWFLHVDKWQNFTILPNAKDQRITK